MPHIVIRIDSFVISSPSAMSQDSITSSVPFWRSVRQSQLNVIVLGAVGIGCVLLAGP